jgi:hypothetical protein
MIIIMKHNDTVRKEGQIRKHSLPAVMFLVIFFSKNYCKVKVKSKAVPVTGRGGL